MTNAIKNTKLRRRADSVLRDVWRIKDRLSASYGHNVDRLFADARKRQKLSGCKIVNFQTKREK